jgi:hypothetical protein
VLAFGPFGVEGRAAGLDEGAAGGQAPAPVGALVRRASGGAGPDRVTPAPVAGIAFGDHAARQAVAALAAPDGEVDSQGGMAPGDSQLVTGVQAGERVLQEQVTALVEAETVKVGSRPQ